MKSATRTPHEIEHDIERDRHELNSTLNALKDQFSVDRMLRASSGPLMEMGGDVGRSVTRAAKNNPMAFALAGAGFAWMLMDSGSQGRASHNGNGRAAERRGRGNSDESSFQDAASAEVSLAWADAESDWQREHDTILEGEGEGDRREGSSPPLSSPSNANDGLPSGSAAFNGSGSSATADTEGASNEGLSGSASHMIDNLKAGTSRGYESAKERVSNVIDRINHGTEELSADARQRVVTARKRALDARDELQRSAHKGAESMQDFYADQPLLTGALALALGAAIGGALPRTRLEDETMGQTRDELVKEANRVYREEMEKARQVARAVVSEGKKVSSELRDEADDHAPEQQTAVDAGVEKAKRSLDRVANAGKTEAEQQGLGDSLRSNS